jgi:CDP-glucose 4,6-dehydratase
MPSKEFWSNKKVLITGNTGFKGSWLTILLLEKGAKIIGISKREKTGLFLYNFLNLNKKLKQYYLDISNIDKISNVLRKEKPDIIFHLAAQPIVKESYKNPYNTLNTNINGTINILETIRKINKKISFINITTDKVYKQLEYKNFFKEENALGGNDIYSSSKACSDMITNSYYKSFFIKKDIGIASARAGNVIGGFDWSANRIIPDTVRASISRKKLIIRMPKSIRPWQHVLDVVNGYTILAEKLYKQPTLFSGSWNFGPNNSSNKDVITLVNSLNNFLAKKVSITMKKSKFHEEEKIQLDSTKSKKLLKWKPKFNFINTIKMTAEIYNLYNKKKLSYEHFSKQISKI